MVCVSVNTRQAGQGTLVLPACGCSCSLRQAVPALLPNACLPAATHCAPSGPPSHPAPLLQRNLFLAADAEARFARTQRRLASGAKAAAAKEGGRPARAEDVVRLYDALIANGAPAFCWLVLLACCGRPALHVTHTILDCEAPLCSDQPCLPGGT